MTAIQTAYRLRVLFEKKITSEYFNSFKGQFGRVQVEVLSYLYDHKQARIHELADTLNVPKQHASKIITRLIEQNLVTKTSDSEDRRSFLFALSNEGLRLMEEHLAISNACFDKRFSKLTKEEQDAMASAMEQLALLLERF